MYGYVHVSFIRSYRLSNLARFVTEIKNMVQITLFHRSVLKNCCLKWLYYNKKNVKEIPVPPLGHLDTLACAILMEFTLH